MISSGELSNALADVDPTERMYQDLSKERRQVSTTMREILKMFGRLNGGDDSCRYD